MRFHKLSWLVLPLLAIVFAGARCEDPPPGRTLYIALGDSLSAGVGASDPASTGFVPLVHSELGETADLMNLGHSGDTSAQLLEHGHLDEAIAEIEKRLADDDGSNDVDLVTLEIGGNDLLALYFSLVLPGICPTIDTLLENEMCSEALASALEGVHANFTETLDRLEDADPDLRLVVMTLYNPFSHLGAIGDLGNISLEGEPGTPFPEGLNDLVRAEAAERGLIVADVHPLFQGETDAVISADTIHPNDDGYQVIAGAVLAALED